MSEHMSRQTSHRLLMVSIGALVGASIAKVVAGSPGAVAFLVSAVVMSILALLDDAQERGKVTRIFGPARPVRSIAVILVAAVGVIAAITGLAQVAMAS